VLFFLTQANRIGAGKPAIPERAIVVNELSEWRVDRTEVGTCTGCRRATQTAICAIKTAIWLGTQFQV
jgi:hypothetical protein